MEAKNNCQLSKVVTAAFDKNLEQLEKLQGSVDPDCRSCNINTSVVPGFPPIQLAIMYKIPVIAKLLILHGSPLDDLDMRNESAMHYAALYGHLDIAKMIVSHGGSFDIKNIDGRTPLHIAIFKRQVDIAKFLIDQGADLTLKDNWGKCVLDQGSYDDDRKQEIVDYIKLKSLGKKSDE